MIVFRFLIRVICNNRNSIYWEKRWVELKRTWLMRGKICSKFSGIAQESSLGRLGTPQRQIKMIIVLHLLSGKNKQRMKSWASFWTDRTFSRKTYWFKCTIKRLIPSISSRSGSTQTPLKVSRIQWRLSQHLRKIGPSCRVYAHSWSTTHPE